jgi:hypothetical protein
MALDKYISSAISERACELAYFRSELAYSDFSRSMNSPRRS